MNVIRNVQALKEQQDLPILPRVQTEIVADDDCPWWLGNFGKAHIEEMISRFGTLICKSLDSYDGHYETFFGDDDDFNENATAEEVKEKVDGLPWLRCIVIDIRTPEYDIPEGR